MMWWVWFCDALCHLLMVESPCQQEPYQVQWANLQFLSHRNCMPNKADSLPCAVSHTRGQVITPYTACPLRLPGSKPWSEHAYKGLSCYRPPPSCTGFISMKSASTACLQLTQNPPQELLSHRYPFCPLTYGGERTVYHPHSHKPAQLEIFPLQKKAFT